MIIKIILSYLLVMNLVGFWSMWEDKKRAKQHRWRISEDMLIMLAFMGGSVGSLLGMKKFRHKTKHPKFYIGIPIILICQVVGILIVIAYKLKLI